MPAHRLWTNEQVTELRRLYRSGVSAKAIAEAEGARRNTVGAMLVGITYRDAPDPIHFTEIRRGAQAQRAVPA